MYFNSSPLQMTFLDFTPIVDFLFPPQCVHCQEPVAQAGALCSACWERVRFIGEPCCAICGFPFEQQEASGQLCAACSVKKPAFECARAACQYDAFSRTLITRLKYADQSHLAATYGRWLATYCKEAVEHSDVLVPVPLHYWRFVMRRFNQAALLAYALKRHTPLPVVPDALLRTRYTRPQAALRRKERLRNVRGAFCANPKRLTRIVGKRVLLVDDVMTTMATVNECCHALRLAGAAEVRVVTLARRVG